MSTKKYVVIENPLGVYECEIVNETKTKYFIKLSFNKNIKCEVKKSAVSDTPEEAKIKYYKTRLKDKKETIENLKDKLLKLEKEYNEELEILNIPELIEKYPEKFI